MTAPISPASKLAHSLQWMTKPGMTGTYVKEVRSTDANTVTIVVRDPNMDTEPDLSPEEVQEAHQWITDNAASILEQTVDGVKLIAATERGSVGEASSYFSADEQYFGSNIPGVTSQAGDVWNDRNNNDVEDPGEDVFLFPVSSKAAGARIDRIVRNELNDKPVEFEVEKR